MIPWWDSKLWPLTQHINWWTETFKQPAFHDGWAVFVDYALSGGSFLGELIEASQTAGGAKPLLSWRVRTISPLQISLLKWPSLFKRKTQYTENWAIQNINSRLQYSWTFGVPLSERLRVITDAGQSVHRTSHQWVSRICHPLTILVRAPRGPKFHGGPVQCYAW